MLALVTAFFRSHRDIAVLTTINNPGAPKSIALASPKDAIPDKKCLIGLRIIELIVFQGSGLSRLCGVKGREDGECRVCIL